MLQETESRIPRDQDGRIPFDPAWLPERFQPEWDRLVRQKGDAVPDNTRGLGPMPAFTPVIMARFLAAFAATGRLGTACRAVGLGNQALENARERFPDFDEAIDEAYQEFTDRLHEEAVRRAVDGWDEPVFYQGEVVGYIRRKSDRILEMLLKAHIPDKFRDKLDVNASVTGGVLVAPAAVTVADWAAQFSALAAPTVIEHQPSA